MSASSQVDEEVTCALVEQQKAVWGAGVSPVWHR